MELFCKAGRAWHAIVLSQGRNSFECLLVCFWMYPKIKMIFVCCFCEFSVSVGFCICTSVAHINRYWHLPPVVGDSVCGAAAGSDEDFCL